LVAVLFRCDAGAEDGLGHVMRCLTLADAFRTAGDDVEFCTAAGPGMVGAERIAARGYRATAAREPVGSPRDRENVGAMVRDVMVIDSRRATPDYVNALAANGFAVVIDDDGMSGLEAALVLNTGLEATADRYPGRAGAADMIGPRFNLIEPALFATRPFAVPARRLLVTFGGEDRPITHAGRWKTWRRPGKVSKSRWLLVPRILTDPRPALWLRQRVPW
jgi:UDP-2,4-diacetamido-2,4,6-trideoxy-beta-L-altropyranose hydrolase